MDREKYFAKLSRCLGKKEIETGTIENGRLTVCLDGYPACGVDSSGYVYHISGDMLGPESDELYHRTEEIAATVHEYMTEMGNGSHILVGGDDYTKLCTFNHVVLCGREMSNGDYQFVTWLCENDGNLRSGNYYGDNYAGAKQNFAERAGLVPHDSLFSQEQMTEMYSCMDDTLAREYELTDTQEKLIKKTCEQIERSVPDLQERTAQAQAEFGQTMKFGYPV